LQDIESKKLEKTASFTNAGNSLILGCIKIVIRFYENNQPLRAISLDKCCEVQHVFEHCEMQSTMCRNCFSFGQNAALQFSHVAVPV